MSISSVGAGTGFGRWTFPDDTSNLFRDDGNRTTGVAQPQATQQVAQLPPTLPSAKDLRSSFSGAICRLRNERRRFHDLSQAAHYL
jgi:hypothetical protein